MARTRLNGAGAEAVAKSVGGIAVQADVTKEADVQRIARTAEEKFGRIDLFCSNAGTTRAESGLDAIRGPPGCGLGRLAWGVNVMARVYRGARRSAGNDRAKIRLVPQYGVGGGAALADRIGGLFDVEARGDRVRRTPRIPIATKENWNSAFRFCVLKRSTRRCLAALRDRGNMSMVCCRRMMSLALSSRVSTPRHSDPADGRFRSRTCSARRAAMIAGSVAWFGCAGV